MNNHIFKTNNLKVNMNKLLIAFIFGIFLLGGVLAIDDLGSSKVNQPYQFCQVCSDATYINLTSIKTPNDNVLLNTAMLNLRPGIFCYNYTPVTIGRYDFKGISDGCEKTFATYLQVTPSGFLDTMGFYFILLAIAVGLLILGFSIKDGWFVVFGGLALISIGLYSINQGIAGMKDTFMTWGISIFLIGVGAYLSIRATLEMLNE